MTEEFRRRYDRKNSKKGMTVKTADMTVRILKKVKQNCRSVGKNSKVGRQ